jgi:hypothetical protein
MKKTFYSLCKTMGPLAGLFLLSTVLTLLFSCAQDNTLGTTKKCTEDPRVDTLRDTIHHTPTDTDTVYITKIIPVGKQKVVLFGTAVHFQTQDTNYQVYDSIQASLTAYAGTNTNSLTVSFNNNKLEVVEGMETEKLLNNLNLWLQSPSPLDAGVLSNLTGVTYVTTFPKTISAYACTVIVPYYESDTSTALSYDTLSDSVIVPDGIDTLFMYDAAGNRYDTVDYYMLDLYYNLQIDTIYRIRMDEDLKIGWKRGNADWYAIKVQKVIDYSFFGGYGAYLVGTSIDTFTTETELIIPQSYVFQPDTDALIFDTSYSLLDIVVYPVSGPQPAQWDSLAAFGGSGHMFGFTYEAGRAFPLTDPYLFEVRLAKARRQPLMAPRKPPSPQEVVSGLLKKYGAGR